MSETVRPFVWNARTVEAANLLAADELADEAIAAKVGVSGRQLRRWKEHPDFREKVEATAKEMTAAILARGIARKAKRVQALDRRWNRMLAVIDARAADQSMVDVPGGATGLLVRRVKSIGSGDNAHEVEEFEVDTGLLRELREIEKQAAQEMGQWVEKQELTGADGGPVRFGLEDVVAAENELEKWKRERRGDGADSGANPPAA